MSGTVELVRLCSKLLKAGQDDRVLQELAAPGGRALLSATLEERDGKESGRTLLHIACGRDRVVVIRKALDMGADPCARDGEGDTPLAVAARFARSMALEEMLLDPRVDVDAANLDGNTALHLAATTNKPEVARKLLEKGADPHVRNKAGYTPYRAAVVDAQRGSKYVKRDSPILGFLERAEKERPRKRPRSSSPEPAGHVGRKSGNGRRAALEQPEIDLTGSWPPPDLPETQESRILSQDFQILAQEPTPRRFSREPFVPATQPPVSRTPKQVGGLVGSSKDSIGGSKVPAANLFDRAAHKCTHPFNAMDGHHVRSKGEVLVDNALRTLGILHDYEPARKVNNVGGGLASIRPDWHLPGYDVYIEYWGMDTPEYVDRKNWKKTLYGLNELNVIHLTEEDTMSSGLEEKLSKKLETYRRRSILE
ncbi:hypothetical protein DFJ74DRAFT_695844 [Hyaloraphidium curvatum]|nr:hypothetical protein DFJ74DRAFT_695844 [Hyaloraphidium curvatum]